MKTFYIFIAVAVAGLILFFLAESFVAKNKYYTAKSHYLICEYNNLKPGDALAFGGKIITCPDPAEYGNFGKGDLENE